MSKRPKSESAVCSNDENAPPVNGSEGLPSAALDEDDESADLCPICHDTLNDERNDDVPLACGHVFHSECLARWMKRKPDCPTCRNPIDPLDVLLARARSAAAALLSRVPRRELPRAPPVLGRWPSWLIDKVATFAIGSAWVASRHPVFSDSMVPQPPSVVAPNGWPLSAVCAAFRRGVASAADQAETAMIAAAPRTGGEGRCGAAAVLLPRAMPNMTVVEGLELALGRDVVPLVARDTSVEQLLCDVDGSEYEEEAPGHTLLWNDSKFAAEMCCLRRLRVLSLSQVCSWRPRSLKQMPRFCAVVQDRLQGTAQPPASRNR